MERDEYSKLLQRYLSALEEGKEAYFDADEILFLLDCFEDNDELTHYKGVLSIGLKFYPENEELKIKKCRFLTFEDDYKGALALAKGISEKNNQELDAIRLECYFYLKEYDKAYEYMDELIIDLSCTYVEELFEHIATFLNDLDVPEMAEAVIRYGLLGFPDNAILNNELCYLHELKGEINESISICNHMIDKNPYSYDFWFTLGRLYSITNEYDKAIDAFDFASTCDEPETDLLILKAYCLFMNEHYKKAIETYQEIIAVDDLAVEHVQSLMAECYIKLEEYEQAYHILLNTINHDNDSAEASTYINFIRCCIETDREREAAKTLFKAAKLFPDNIRILALLALTFLENGKEDMALSVTDKIFNQLEQQDDNNTEEWQNLVQKGQAFFLKGEFKKALKYYNKILQLNPHMSFTHFHMAMAYFSYAEQIKSGKQSTHARVFTRPEKYIPLEDLTKEYLNNKTNNN